MNYNLSVGFTEGRKSEYPGKTSKHRRDQQKSDLLNAIGEFKVSDTIAQGV
jgi:hypothetical protein